VSDTLGERIKSLRISRGLTGAQLAARIGIGENAVFKLESGTSAEPKFHVGIKLARALGVTPEALAFGESRGAFGESTPPAVPTKVYWGQGKATRQAPRRRSRWSQKSAKS